MWTSEFVLIRVDSDSGDIRFETIEQALVVADELGVDCQVFVEETGKLPVQYGGFVAFAGPVPIEVSQRFEGTDVGCSNSRARRRTR